MIDPARVHDRILKTTQDWAVAQDEADRAEAARKRIFSVLVIGACERGASVSKAEHQARASDEYTDACQKAADAALKANQARAVKDSASVWWEAVRTAEATKRTELGLR